MSSFCLVLEGLEVLPASIFPADVIGKHGISSLQVTLLRHIRAYHQRAAFK